MKGFTLGLALKQRRNATRKSPIQTRWFPNHMQVKFVSPQKEVISEESDANCINNVRLIGMYPEFIPCCASF